MLLVRDGHRERAEVRVEAVLPLPAHEGSVLSVGDHVVEVVVEPDARAHLYVLNAPAPARPSGGLDVELTLSIAGEDGHLHPISLSWSEESQHYTGHVEGLQPHAGPMEVILERGGREYLGRGTLLEVGLRRPDILGDRSLEAFRLELPELGSELPAVIAVPPPDAD